MIGLRTELHIPDIKAIFCHKSCSLPWKVCNTKKHKSWSDKSDCWSLEEEVEKIMASLLGKEQFSTVVSEGDSSFKTCRKRHSLELKIENYFWFFPSKCYRSSSEFCRLSRSSSGFKSASKLPRFSRGLTEFASTSQIFIFLFSGASDEGSSRKYAVGPMQKKRHVQDCICRRWWMIVF